MEYKYTKNENYEDFVSGRVLYHYYTNYSQNLSLMNSWPQKVLFIIKIAKPLIHSLISLLIATFIYNQYAQLKS